MKFFIIYITSIHKNSEVFIVEHNFTIKNMDVRKFINDNIALSLGGRHNTSKVLKIDERIYKILEQEFKEPNIWYHGTDNIFEQPNFTNSGDEMGFHLGTYEQALNVKGGNTPKYINSYRVANISPLRLKDLQFWTSEIIAKALIDGGISVDRSGKGFMGSRYYTDEDVLNALKSNGFDSIIYKNEYEGDGDSILVFDNRQLKFLGRESLHDNHGE